MPSGGSAVEGRSLGRAERTLWRGLTVLVLAGVVWTPAPAARAETVLLYREVAHLGRGVRLSYFTDQRRVLVATYTAEVDILSVETDADGLPETVRFRWHIFGASSRPGMDDRGTVTSSGLRRGRSMNAWWAPGQAVTTRDTHVWMSVEACEELRSSDETRFAVDVNLRRDEALRVRRVRAVDFPVLVDGRPVTLRAMELRSERDDRIVMLDQCEHPLVLEADIPGISLMRLRQITTGLDFGDQEGGP